MELLIVEKSGWSKSLKTDRAVIRVGSAPSNDVPLPSPAIAPVHLQILHCSDTDSCCKVVNLAHEITARVSHETRVLPPFAALDLRDGDEILLDGYSITFRLPLSADVVQSARNIQATLSFAEAVLQSTFAATGMLTVKNAGERSACQFQVNIEGLPADCLQIDPIPLMYAGAQEEVRIRIFHRTLYPLAGLRTMIVKVSAPESYPGEELIIRQQIYVTPVFKQTLELFDDLRAVSERKKPAEPPDLAAKPVPLSELEPAPVSGADKQADSAPAVLSPRESSSLDPLTGAEPIPADPPPGPAISGLKVVRAPHEEDEESKEAPRALPRKAPLEILSADCPDQPPENPVQKPALPDVSRVKVVRDRSDSERFWNEE